MSYLIIELTLIVKLPGRVAQSATCLTADPGFASLIPAQSHTFVEIDHEIISFPFRWFKKGCCQLQVKVCACAQSTGLALSQACSGKKCG